MYLRGDTITQNTSILRHCIRIVVLTQFWRSPYYRDFFDVWIRVGNILATIFHKTDCLLLFVWIKMTIGPKGLFLPWKDKQMGLGQYFYLMRPRLTSLHLVQNSRIGTILRGWSGLLQNIAVYGGSGDWLYGYWFGECIRGIIWGKLNTMWLVRNLYWYKKIFVQ